MANFAVTNSTGLILASSKLPMTTTFKTIIGINNGSSLSTNCIPSVGAAGGPTRGKIYDILIGTDTTPGDTVVYWDLARQTTWLSSTNTYTSALTSASSLFALDTADYTCWLGLQGNSTLEVTYTAEVWSIGINQRASYRWVAAPGSEFVIPAVSSNGIGLRAMGPTGGSAYTGNVTATVLVQQQ